MISTLQKMDEAGPDCDRRFKEILARQPLSSDESSQPQMKPTKKTGHNRKDFKTPSKPASRKITNKSAKLADSEVLSLLSPNLPDREQRKPDPLDVLDDDFEDDDLPDPRFLFSSGTKPSNSQKQSMAFVDSDDL
jgi:ATP-dependent DNA helicase MPH1